MEYIGKNDELLQQSIPGGYYILDSIITRFDIYYQKEQLNIDVYLELAHNKVKPDKNLKQHFLGVTEYDFHWNNKYNFYTVERYKFLKTESGYFISFDPYDESREILETDGDVIYSREVEAYFV